MSFRGYSQPPTLVEKLISAASYLTMGLVGFIWLIIMMVQRSSPSQFLQYHIYQSIFVSVIIALTSLFLQFILPIIAVIPLIGPVIMTMIGYSALLVGPLIFFLQVYFAIFAFLGKYSYFPGISQNVNQMINRY